MVKIGEVVKCWSRDSFQTEALALLQPVFIRACIFLGIAGKKNAFEGQKTGHPGTKGQVAPAGTATCQKRKGATN